MAKLRYRLCSRCGKVKILYGRPIYCGSDKKKKGCSYIVKLERTRKWRKSHPEYWRVEEKWKKESQYYKRKDVIAKRRERQKEAYKLKVTKQP